jgi:hypothetical protein
MEEIRSYEKYKNFKYVSEAAFDGNPMQDFADRVQEVQHGS